MLPLHLTRCEQNDLNEQMKEAGFVGSPTSHLEVGEITSARAGSVFCQTDYIPPMYTFQIVQLQTFLHFLTDSRNAWSKE